MFFSSCFDSLISTFWKYPERFSAVIKFATALIDAEELPSKACCPCGPFSVSQRFSVRDTVLATISSSFLPAGAVALQLLDRRNSLLQDYLLLFERFDLQLVCFQIRSFAPSNLLISAFSLFSWFCHV